MLITALKKTGQLLYFLLGLTYPVMFVEVVFNFYLDEKLAARASIDLTK